MTYKSAIATLEIEIQMIDSRIQKLKLRRRTSDYQRVLRELQSEKEEHEKAIEVLRDNN